MLRSKPRQTLFIDVDSERLVARHYYVDPQVELVSVDQQRVRDVAGDDGCVINVQLIQGFYQVDAAAARRIGRLDDPDVSLWLRLPQFLEMSMEVVEFIWKNVSLGDEVKLLSTKTLLHLDIVIAKTILPRNLVTLWEVIDSLELVQALIKIALARAGRPEEVPLVRVSVAEGIVFKD